MSTDFCVETLLRGSSSNTSVTSIGSNTDLHLIVNALNTSPIVKSQENIKESHLSPQPSSSPIIISPPRIAVGRSGPLIQSPADLAKVSGTAKKKGTKRKHSEEVVAPSSKKKRVRTVYSPEQIQKLEDNFTRTQYPDLLMREDIAEEMGIDERKIHTWFQNRRAKQRKTNGNPVSAVYNSQRMPALHTPTPLPAIPQFSPSLPHPYTYPTSRISVSPIQTAGLPTPPNTVIGTSRTSSPADSPLPVYLPLRSLSPHVSSPNQLVNSPPLYGAAYQFGRSSLSPHQPFPFIPPYDRPPTTMHSPVYHPGPQMIPSYQRNNPATLHLSRRSSPGVDLHSSLPKSSQTTPILTSYLSSPPNSVSSSVSYGQCLPLRREPSPSNFVFVPSQTAKNNYVNDMYFGVVY